MSKRFDFGSTTPVRAEISGEKKEKDKITTKEVKKLQIKIPITQAKQYFYRNHKKILLIIMGIVSLWIGGILGQGIETIRHFGNSEAFQMHMDPFRCAIWAVTSISGWVGTIVSAIICLYLYKTQIRSRIKIPTGVYDEKRNFHYSDKGTYGTSRWISREELEKVAEVKGIEDTQGSILGMTADCKIVSLPTKEEFDAKHKGEPMLEQINYMLNRHKAVAGSSGTMKSRAVCMNEIFQAVRRDESMVVTDPKGELAESFCQYLKSKGYDVKILNLTGSNMLHSDSWNCLAEIRGNPVDAEIFAQCIVENIAEGETGYWKNNAQNLLKAVCQYVEWEPNLPTTMGTVCDTIAGGNLATLQSRFEQMPSNHPARRAYNIFAQCKPEVQGQILNNLGIYLSIFQSDVVREVTGHSEIDLEKPEREKCAYFCVTSDQYKAFDFLAVLFYTMLFIRLVEAARKRSTQKAKVPINFILDEFANIGSIPDFNRKISTVRSVDINITVIFQAISQMQNRYPYGMWEEILGNCDTCVCLGNTDATTQDFFSKKTGTASVEVKTEASSYERERMFLQKETEEKQNESVGKRELMLPDEVARMQNNTELIFLRGQKPLQLLKYDYSNHPDSRLLCPMKLADYTPNWYRELVDRGDWIKLRSIDPNIEIPSEERVLEQAGFEREP